MAILFQMKLLGGDRHQVKYAEGHWLRRYGLAVVLVAITIGLALTLTHYGIKLNFTIPVVVALVAGTWYGGRGPGLLIGVLFQTTTIIYAKVPEDSSIYAVIFGYFSTLCLYVFLAVLISGLRKILRSLSEQRDLLQVTLASIGDAVIATNTRGRITFMNPVAEELTGWRESNARGHALEEVFRTVDDDSGKVVINPVERVLATGILTGLSNHTRLISKSGVEIPIDNNAAPIRHEEEIKGVVLVFSDVSERKAAERSLREREIMQRIVEAQEAERHRIARDLHDHLGQKMTALRLGIENIVCKAPRDRAFSRAVDALQGAAANIDQDIGYLSWELRPTELEDLGLADALQSFVREWSIQFATQAEFHLSDPDLDSPARFSPTVETNLYRIVQEALHNVVKHADATCVNVLLQRRNDQLILIIEDDGKGFDPRPPTGSLRRSEGLGIVGMRERAALLKGTFEIETSPLGGTSIVVSVPLETAN